MRQAREFMRLPGAKGKTGVDKLARVCGLDALFVGECDEYAIGGGYFVDARATDGEEMSGATGVSYGFVLRWGTASGNIVFTRR